MTQELRDRHSEGFQGLLRHPQLAVAAILGALFLTLPALFGPLVLDDFVLGLLSRGDGDIAGFADRNPNALFTFTTGDPASNRALMAEGVLLPWWADPNHLNAFLRPLSSLTHRLDFWLFPNAAVPMRAHSLLWFLALLFAASRLYRSLHPAPASLAGLALVLFAWDDPHGATLGWIANRNALVAGALGLPAVLLHRRLALARGTAVQSGERWRQLWRWLAGPACFAMGMLAGEAALGVLGYVLAHALCLERDAFGGRLLRLLPYGAVLLAWRLLYRSLGLGSQGSGAYHDPIREPLAFMAALLNNLPILLGAQHGPPYADAAFWGPPEHKPLLVLLSYIILMAVAAIALPLLRKVPLARFYALGSALAAIPVAASLPGERLLLLVGIGGSGLVALLLDHYLERLDGLRAARPILLVLAGLHLVAAPLGLPAMSFSMSMVGHACDRADASLPSDPSVAEQTFVMLNAPFDVAASYVQPTRAYRGKPRPRHLHWLATASSPIRVTRDGPRALIVESQRGILYSPQAHHYRGDLSGLAAGARVELPAMTAEILAADPTFGPTRVRFTFAMPLDSPTLSLFFWRDREFHRIEAAALAEPHRFDTEHFFEIVLFGAAGY